MNAIMLYWEQVACYEFVIGLTKRFILPKDKFVQLSLPIKFYILCGTDGKMNAFNCIRKIEGKVFAEFICENYAEFDANYVALNMTKREIYDKPKKLDIFELSKKAGELCYAELRES